MPNRLYFHYLFVILHPTLVIGDLVNTKKMMTPEEYVQLKAFARQDGALMALLWIGALVCYVQGLTNGLMGLAAVAMIVATPFLAANRLRHFRDEARGGSISFGRAYAYTVLVFFYGGLLLAAAMFVYFYFIDGGYLMGKYQEMMGTEENRRLLDALGMRGEMEEGLRQLADMRAIDYALNMLTANIMAGMLLGIPIAALKMKHET